MLLGELVVFKNRFTESLQRLTRNSKARSMTTITIGISAILYSCCYRYSLCEDLREEKMSSPKNLPTTEHRSHVRPEDDRPKWGKGLL